VAASTGIGRGVATIQASIVTVLHEAGNAVKIGGKIHNELFDKEVLWQLLSSKLLSQTFPFKMSDSDLLCWYASVPI
jgi:hypothetical protein